MKKSGPQKIGDLFEKYKKTIVAPEASVVEAFCEVVADVCSIEITSAAVSYNPRKRTLVITKGGLLKSEILTYKSEIINHLKGRLGERSAPRDII